MRWEDRVKGAIAYAVGEVIGWIIIGVALGLAVFAAEVSIYLSIAIVLCWVALLFLMFRRSLIRDIEALDDPNPSPRASRLIAGREH